MDNIKCYPEFPEYLVSRDGRVFRDGHEIRQRDHRNKYKMVTLSVNGKAYTRYVHRMVCATFHGPQPPRMQCRHLDGSRTKNISSNLEWATAKVNNADKKIHGTNNNGESHVASILTNEIVIEARDMFSRGMKIKDIACHLSVGRHAIRAAIRGDRWAHLPNAQPAPEKREKDKMGRFL